MKPLHAAIFALFGLVIAATGLAAQVSCPTYTSQMAAIKRATVAALPTCNAGLNGSIYVVTDALLPTVLGTLTGGGAVTTLIHCNGTAWVAG